MAEKEHEVRIWIERYEQVMMDLHASQFRLMQMARGVFSSCSGFGASSSLPLNVWQH